jgi:hypothetical protein
VPIGLQRFHGTGKRFRGESKQYLSRPFHLSRCEMGFGDEKTSHSRHSSHRKPQQSFIQGLSCQALIMVSGIEPWEAMPLHRAARDGNLAEISRLFRLSLEDLNTHDENNMIPLHICTQINDISAVELLLTYGTDPNLQVTGDHSEFVSDSNLVSLAACQ